MVLGYRRTATTRKKHPGAHLQKRNKPDKQAFRRVMRTLTSPNKLYVFRQVGIIASGGGGADYYNVSGKCTYDSTNGQLALATAGIGGAAFAFRLFDLDNLGSYQAIFDQYKILMIKVTFIPSGTEVLATAGITTVGNIATISVAPDYDDIVAPSTNAYLRQYNSVREYGMTKKFSIVIKPRLETSVQTSTGLVAAGNMGMWVDTATSQPLHYGLKVSCTASNNQQQWDMYAEYVVAFKNVR